MAHINILPKEVYSLIAAGEVVERPMSVVKEMLENSIDAGARHITVEIKNGGATYIRITDDGSGIAKEDVKKVFVSHATSKISTGEDLNSIGTLGFRGEAMASIAAVAKVELLTKAQNESTGTRYEISGGEEISFSDAGCPNGTTVVVRDLFFNVPARMKFLKKDVTEGNAVQGVVERLALSHPEISFRFIREGRQAIITSGNSDLKGTVYSVFGSELSDTLIEADYSYASMRLSGFVSRPHQSRKTRAMQFFFINGRLVKSATAMAALEQAYKNLIMVGRYPACVLNIEIDPRLVDVNVHPAKTEVRFINEKPVFDLVYYGVKTAIEAGDSVKAGGFYTDSLGRRYVKLEQHSEKIDFGIKPEPPSQLKFSGAPAQGGMGVSASDSYEKHIRADSYGNPGDFVIKSGRIFNDSETVAENEYSTTVSVDLSGGGAAETEKPGAEIQREEYAVSLTPPKNESGAVVDEKDALPPVKIVGEAFDTYIIAEIKNDLYYIDKHAAHERMNFERLKKDAAQNGIATQTLLVPVAVSMNSEEYEAVVSNLELLSKCGFGAENFGSNTVIVRETPALLDGCDVKDLILEIAQKLLEHKTDIEPDKMDWIFHSSSCRAAVKGGDKTSPQERELFVQKLLSMPDIRYCPHGRPVMVKISRYELEKQFGRVQ